MPPPGTKDRDVIETRRIDGMIRRERFMEWLAALIHPDWRMRYVSIWKLRLHYFDSSTRLEFLPKTRHEDYLEDED